MHSDPLVGTAELILHFLCEKLATRRVGSAENLRATDYFAENITRCGFVVEMPRFDCIDWEEHGAILSVNGNTFEVFPSPYTLSFEGREILVAARTVHELECLDMRGKIVLLLEELTASQLMPKNFRFFNPEEHQHIYSLLEAGSPQAVISATGKNPELAGAMYPFPMFEDGDFDIPSVYLKDEDGQRLAEYEGQTISLSIHARRIPATGCNVVAFKKGCQPKKIVVCAHIDAKLGTPGALDNATGTTVLLLLAELLCNYSGKLSVEIVAFNGEDYYASSGEILYLDMNANAMGDIALVINMDGVGLNGYPTAFSFYNCSEKISEKARSIFRDYDMVEGEQWYQGDHSIFIQHGCPAIALTTKGFSQFISDIIHTPKDSVKNVSPQELVKIAHSLAEFINGY